jgi:hypothetical protein
MPRQTRGIQGNISCGLGRRSTYTDKSPRRVHEAAAAEMHLFSVRRDYKFGATSIGPGSVCGEVGSIIVACGPPGPQAGGGHTLHRSPRLNQLLHALRQVLQPERLAIVTITAVSKSSFLLMVVLRISTQVFPLLPGNSSPAMTRCKRSGGILATHGQHRGSTVPNLPVSRALGVAVKPRTELQSAAQSVEKMLQ